MTATLDTTTLPGHMLCYCTDSQHRAQDREQTWRPDLAVVMNDQVNYCPDAHVVRRVSHVEAVTP